MNLISLQDALLAWGDHPLLDGASLTIEEGERYGLIGRNGTGKSSLMKVLAGEEKLDDGVINKVNGLRSVYVEQEPLFPEAPSAIDSLLLRVDRDLLNDDRLKWQIKSKLIDYLHRLGINESELDLKKASGGEKKKAALAAALAQEPDLLLLDEPTNHLDIAAILQLESILLAEFRGSRSLVTVTHDRSFLDKVSSKIIELDRGNLSVYPGSFDEYEKRKTEFLESEEKANRQFDKFWAQEEVWIRKGIEARRTRNEGRVRRLEELRRIREQRRDRIGLAKLSLDPGERSGKMVAELESVSKSFGNRTIIKDLSLRIMRGDKLGLLGPNGAGKTTLIKIILGQMQPDSGTVRLGSNLQVAYFDQLRKELDLDKDLMETVSPGSEWVETNGTKKHVISYLGDFLFPPHRMNVKVSSLSGGERNRLLLAKLFAKPANLLVMDEPTNDLDIETLELLEDTLARYSGTVILVSHDRRFMDNVATIAIGPDDQGVWTAYVNGYEGWLSDRKKRQALAEKILSEKSATNSKKQERVQPVKIRLTFKEKKELDTLPTDIAKLEEEKDHLVELMQTMDYHAQPAEQIIKDGQRMSEIEEELEKLYERWEELENKRALSEKN